MALPSSLLRLFILSYARDTSESTKSSVLLHSHLRCVSFETNLGFNGAETNCGIADILGILLMNSCNTVIFLATTIICSLCTLNCMLN